MPHVSVIIPTYNRAAMLRECLQSVQVQTYRDFEIIVIDDGSTDDTRATAESFARVRYFYQENRGVAAARNYGIKLARGEYIAFLDSDDLWLPPHLQLTVSFLDAHPQIGMVYTTFTQVNSAHQPIRMYPARTGKHVYKDLLSKWIVAAPTVVARKTVLEAVGGFDETMRVHEDGDLWRRILRRYEVMGIHEPLVLVRLHAENSRVDVREYLRSELYMLEKGFRESPEIGWFDRRKMRARSYLRYGLQARGTLRFNYLLYSFLLYPPYVLRELAGSLKSRAALL
jgi:glycosyltransferase involved in cell wall biosynthesis